jgi:hypothetical protein
VSARAIKHVDELTTLARGERLDASGAKLGASVLFVVTRGDAEAFRPNQEACPSFARHLLAAREAGVHVMAHRVTWGEGVDEGKAFYSGEIPVRFIAPEVVETSVPKVVKPAKKRKTVAKSEEENTSSSNSSSVVLAEVGERPAKKTRSRKVAKVAAEVKVEDAIEVKLEEVIEEIAKKPARGTRKNAKVPVKKEKMVKLSKQAKVDIALAESALAERLAENTGTTVTESALAENVGVLDSSLLFWKSIKRVGSEKGVELPALE